MRLIDNGDAYTVAVSAEEVVEFARRWPCFGPRRALYFQFCKANNDLIDLGGDTNMDPAGVLALSQDAEKFGRLTLATR